MLANIHKDIYVFLFNNYSLWYIYDPLVYSILCLHKKYDQNLTMCYKRIKIIEDIDTNN